MRSYLFYLTYPGVIVLLAYAWRDWFPAVAGLVLMVAVLPNPEMPREVLGIRGLNLWNIMLLGIIPAWLAGRWRERLRFDLPVWAGIPLALYVAVMGVSVLRLWLDPGPMTLGASELVGEYLINPLKFLLPALMVFDGVRTRSRFVLALASILASYVFLSILVIRETPLSDVAGGGSLSSWGLRRILSETGFHRNGASVMLAGASWALISIRPLAKSGMQSMALLGTAGLVFFAQALTAGRGGYLAWLAVGLVLSLLRFRGTLVLAPIALALLVGLIPAVRERALHGLSDSGEEPVDADELSAGRLQVWPYMIAKIGESPVVGFGRVGFERSGLKAYLSAEVDATFPHPHNAYLEWLLDNGWLGMAPMLVLYGLVLLGSLILFTDSRHPYFVVAGGVAFALVFAQLVGSMTGRSWYPSEETVGMWCAVGLMLRVWVERSRGPANAA
jgi:O-Antigen ligase